MPESLSRSDAFTKRAGVVSVALNASAMILSRAYLKVYHRFEVRGTEHLPKDTPFVMVANHASHLDHMCLRNALPLPLRVRTHPLAAGDVFFSSAIRAAVATHVINALPMWRKKISPHAMADLRDRLNTRACAFVLFPEGARTDTGEMQRCKAGIGMLVAGMSVPVVPAYLDGPFHALRKKTWIPRPTKVTTCFGPSLTFADVPNDRDGWEHVVQRVEAAIRALRPA